MSTGTAGQSHNACDKVGHSVKGKKKKKISVAKTEVIV